MFGSIVKGFIQNSIFFSAIKFDLDTYKPFDIMSRSSEFRLVTIGYHLLEESNYTTLRSSSLYRFMKFTLMIQILKKMNQ